MRSYLGPILAGLAMFCVFDQIRAFGQQQPTPQPTLEQNVDAMTSKGVSIMAAFHDTVLGLNAANQQLATQNAELIKERDALKAERDGLKQVLQNTRGRRGAVPTETLPEEQPTK